MCLSLFCRTIDRGESVKWKMMIQVMQPEQVESLEFDPFDVTGMHSDP